ncbi:MAG: hypothetical protein LBM04_05960 [Opitutaceae bacterium]|jgi:hypothetical protein|nr:hypothetical protein [Opitutaceae bacterium]
MKAMKKAAKKATKRPVETIDQVAARLRGQYRKHTPEQREIYGGEPSEGTIMGEWIRAQCNGRTREQRRAGALGAMALIHGKEAAVANHETSILCG